MSAFHSVHFIFAVYVAPNRGALAPKRTHRHFFMLSFASFTLPLPPPGIEGSHTRSNNIDAKLALSKTAKVKHNHND